MWFRDFSLSRPSCLLSLCFAAFSSSTDRACRLLPQPRQPSCALELRRVTPIRKPQGRQGTQVLKEPARRFQVIGGTARIQVPQLLRAGCLHAFELALERLDFRIAQELHRQRHLLRRWGVLVTFARVPGRVKRSIGDPAEVRKQLKVQLAAGFTRTLPGQRGLAQVRARRV